MPCRPRIRVVRARALATSFALVAAAAAAGAASAAPTLLQPACDLRHPIEVRVTPEGAVQPGQRLQLRVSVVPSVELQQARVELVGLDGAQKAGAGSQSLGTLAAGAEASAIFAVQVPADRHRTLLTFLVRGEGPRGALARHATFNVLPDGPADPGIARTGSNGARIVEYRARRLP